MQVVMGTRAARERAVTPDRRCCRGLESPSSCNSKICAMRVFCLYDGLRHMHRFVDHQANTDLKIRLFVRCCFISLRAALHSIHRMIRQIHISIWTPLYLLLLVIPIVTQLLNADHKSKNSRWMSDRLWPSSFKKRSRGLASGTISARKRRWEAHRVAKTFPWCWKRAPVPLARRSLSPPRVAPAPSCSSQGR